jgi:hypothetical protein
VKLPGFAVVSIDDLNAVGDRHGLDVKGRCEQLPEAGIFNAVYGMGDHYILRIRETIRHTSRRSIGRL